MLEEVMDAIEEARGDKLNKFIVYEAFEKVVSSRQKKWSRIAQECLNSVKYSFQTTVESVIGTTFERFPKMKDELT